VRRVTAIAPEIGGCGPRAITGEPAAAVGWALAAGSPSEQRWESLEWRRQHRLLWTGAPAMAAAATATEMTTLEPAAGVAAAASGNGNAGRPGNGGDAAAPDQAPATAVATNSAEMTAAESGPGTGNAGHRGNTGGSGPDTVAMTQCSVLCTMNGTAHRLSCLT
jgi:hypothetical protein